MAVHMVGNDGNSAVVVEGQWNAGNPNPLLQYTSGVAGATSLGIVWTMQADNPLPTTGTLFAGATRTSLRPLCQCWNAGTGSHVFNIRYDTAAQTLAFTVNDENFNTRTATSAPNLLIPGFPQRLVWRWRASPERFSLQINGVECPLTLSGTAIAHLFNQLVLVSAPLELGDEDADDAASIGMTVQQWAVTTTDLSDAQAAIYGSTGNPGAMGLTWLHWVTLAQASITVIDPENHYAPGPSPVLGHLTDAQSGHDYSLDTALYNYGGGNFTMPAHGVYATITSTAFTVVPDLSVIAPPSTPWYKDPSLPILPQRGFEEWEHAAQFPVRSGNAPLLVPSVFGTVQAAWNAAVYGDDIIVSHTASGLQAGLVPPPTKAITSATPRNPPRGRTPITGHVPITGSVPITGHTPITGTSRDPAYIRIMSDAMAALPQIARRAITGLPPGDPPQWVSDAPDGTSCRVRRTDYANMPALNCTGNIAVMIGSAPNQFVLGRQVCYVYFGGLRFASSDGAAKMWITGDNASQNAVSNAFRYGMDTNSPHHLIFDRCAWDPDTGNTGNGGSVWLNVEGQYIGIWNSIIDKFFVTGGGENNLLLCFGDDWGPFHLENNEIPLVQTQSFFFGGNNVCLSVGVQMQDNVFQRNWQPTPATWRVEQVRRAFVVQFIGTDASTVHYISGGLGGGFYDPGVGYQWAVQYGDIMYEPATGKARLVSFGNAFPNGSAIASVGLQSPWPAPSFGTPMTTYFQMAQPRVILNTGLLGSDFAAFTDVPVATVSNGSIAVTFTLNGVGWALPATVQAGQFLFLNNLHEDDSPAGSATNNAYGSFYGVTYANCRRKKITAIAGDRKSCTLENPYIVLGGEPTTFPFTVTPCDGLWRSAWTAGKGAWETKCSASRMVMQGNVFEFPLQAGTLHCVVNASFGDSNGRTFTLANNIATVSPALSGYANPNFMRLRRTFNPRGWPYNGAEVPWPYEVLIERVDNSADFWTQTASRVMWDSDFATQVICEPLTGAINNGVATVGPGAPFSVSNNGAPWWTTKGFTYRYNLSVGGGVSSCSTRIANNEESNEFTKGQWANFHDNVGLLCNELAANFGGGFTTVGLNFPAGPGPNGFGTFNTCVGQTSQDTSYTRCAHNTYAHVANIQGFGTFTQIDQGLGITAKTHDVDVSDSVIAGINGGFALLGTPSNSVNPASAWAMDPTCRAARNVLIGSTAVTAAADPNLTAFPDNAGVPTYDAAGFPAFEAIDATSAAQTLSTQIVAGLVNPADMTKYALADIATAGTVSIDPTGLIVTLDSGAFPPTVQAGQFFKTIANGTLTRIRTVGSNPTLSANWQTYTGVPAIVVIAGGGAVQGTQNAAHNTESHTQALANDQWVQGTAALFNQSGNGFGLGLRFSTPQTENGYVLNFGFGGWSIQRIDAGVFHSLASGSFALAQGAVVTFTAVVNVLTGLVNGVPIGSYDTTPDATKYTSGRAAIDLIPFAGVNAVQLSNFACGHIVGGALVQPPDATDTFGAGTATTLTLFTAYPVSNITTQPYVITFKGTATDSKDPGADLNLVEQFTRNVRTRAIP